MLAIAIVQISRYAHINPFLRATAATAVALPISYHNSVCPSVTRVDQSKMVQGRITQCLNCVSHPKIAKNLTFVFKVI